MYWGSERKWLLQELRSKPALTATTAVGTDVVVIGKVSPLGPELDGPLSGRPCVAFCALIYPKGIFAGPPLAHFDCVPFMLERSDGSSVVIDSASTNVRFVFPPLPLPDDAQARCLEHAIEAGLSPRQRKRATYEEIIVIETMKIAVAGRLVAGWANAPARVAGDAARPIIIGVPF